MESLLSLGEVLLEDFIFVFDSTVTPWTMHLRRAPQEATRSLVYRRNMTGLSRSVDGRIITRLYGRGYGEGDNQLTIASVNGGLPYLTADAETIDLYGDEWDGVHVDTRQTDPATLKAHMARILEAGKRPTVSYEATAIDLARLTGERWDDIRIGEKVIVLDELLGIPVTVRCAGRKKGDVEGDPGAIVLTLDNSRADTAEELSEIRDKIGVHELYSQGATNMYSMQLSDNADASHPLVMRFYVPGNVLRINSCLIYWQTERFRTYATLAKSGGGSTRTSQIGGGATVSLPVRIVTTAASTGAPQHGEGSSALYTDQNTEGLATREVDDHRHSVESHAHNLNGHTHGSFSSGPSPAVTVANGAGNTGRAGKHAHDIDAHTHKFDHWHKVTVTMTIPAMSFELESHSHTVTIPEHEHELEYGVYEGARSASIAIRVDGEAVPAEALTDSRELDVAKYLRKNDDGRVTRGTWHEIEFAPDGITRITADLFFQVFIQSRGAGDY